MEVNAQIHNVNTVICRLLF